VPEANSNLPHVTAVLSTLGLYDFRWASEQAKERGSRIHRAISFLADNDLDWKSVDEEEVGYVRAAQKFLRDTEFKVELVECHVSNPVYGYQGTLDLEGRVRGIRRTLVDWKSSETGLVVDEVALQLAAYGFALDPAAIFDRVGVGLMPDGTYKIKWFKTEDYREDCHDFLAALRVCKRLERTK